jgi:hypothetical protein
MPLFTKKHLLFHVKQITKGQKMNLTDIFLSDGSLSPTLILWAFFLAVVIATVIYYLTNAQLCKLISKLLEIGADSPEKAVYLKDAEINLNFLLRFSLKSPINYKNLLVAITPDGKFYANSFYTDTPPVIKELKAITRIRRSKVKEKKSTPEKESETNSLKETATEVAIIEGNTDAVNGDVVPRENTPKTQEILPQNQEVYTQNTPQRVKFEPLYAKYYIPKQVHDRVKNLYKAPKIKPLYLILALLGFAVVTFLATLALDTFIEMFSSIGS